MGTLEFFTVLVICGLPVLCVTLVIIVAMLRKGPRRKRDRIEADETRLIQELNQGINKLESRIDSLETILLENERRKGKKK